MSKLDQLTIDCDGKPWIPSDTILHSPTSLPKKPGVVRLGSIRAYREDYSSQTLGDVIVKSLLDKEEGIRIMNSRALKGLLENEEIIPQDWKNLVIHFPGDLYRPKHLVLCLYWEKSEARWAWSINDIDELWSSGQAIAIVD